MRNARQEPESGKTYHEVLGEGNDLERHLGISKTAGRAYVSPPSSPRIDEGSSPDLETTALLRLVRGGDNDIFNDVGRKEYFDEGADMTHNFERSGSSAGVESNSQFFEQQSPCPSFGQRNLDCAIGDSASFPSLQNYTDGEQGQNCLDMSLAPVLRRRKVVIPKIPDFSKLLERCT